MRIGGVWRARRKIGHHSGQIRHQRKALLSIAGHLVAATHVVQDLRQASVLRGRCIGVDIDKDESGVQIHVSLGIVNGKGWQEGGYCTLHKCDICIFEGWTNLVG